MTKKNLIIIALVLLIIIAARPVGELNGITKKTKRFQEENPYGMVFVKRGSFIMGANDQSAIGSLSDKSINVTVDAFWMDATEITNNEYKQFVHWVRDSIAMRMLINSNALGYQKLTTYNNTSNAYPTLKPPATFSPAISTTASLTRYVNPPQNLLSYSTRDDKSSCQLLKSDFNNTLGFNTYFGFSNL